MDDKRSVLIAILGILDNGNNDNRLSGPTLVQPKRHRQKSDLGSQISQIQAELSRIDSQILTARSRSSRNAQALYSRKQELTLLTLKCKYLAGIDSLHSTVASQDRREHSLHLALHSLNVCIHLLRSAEGGVTSADSLDAMREITKRTREIHRRIEKREKENKEIEALIEKILADTTTEDKKIGRDIKGSQTQRPPILDFTRLPSLPALPTTAKSHQTRASNHRKIPSQQPRSPPISGSTTSRPIIPSSVNLNVFRVKINDCVERGPEIAAKVSGFGGLKRVEGSENEGMVKKQKVDEVGVRGRGLSQVPLAGEPEAEISIAFNQNRAGSTHTVTDKGFKEEQSKSELPVEQSVKRQPEELHKSSRKSTKMFIETSFPNLVALPSINPSQATTTRKKRAPPLAIKHAEFIPSEEIIMAINKRKSIASLTNLKGKAEVVDHQAVPPVDSQDNIKETVEPVKVKATLAVNVADHLKADVDIFIRQEATLRESSVGLSLIYNIDSHNNELPMRSLPFVELGQEKSNFTSENDLQNKANHLAISRGSKALNLNLPKINEASLDSPLSTPEKSRPNTPQNLEDKKSAIENVHADAEKESTPRRRSGAPSLNRALFNIPAVVSPRNQRASVKEPGRDSIRSPGRRVSPNRKKMTVVKKVTVLPTNLVEEPPRTIETKMFELKTPMPAKKKSPLDKSFSIARNGKMMLMQLAIDGTPKPLNFRKSIMYNTPVHSGLSKLISGSENSQVSLDKSTPYEQRRSQIAYSFSDRINSLEQFPVLETSLDSDISVCTYEIENINTIQAQTLIEKTEDGLQREVIPLGSMNTYYDESNIIASEVQIFSHSDDPTVPANSKLTRLTLYMWPDGMFSGMSVKYVTPAGEELSFMEGQLTISADTFTLDEGDQITSLYHGFDSRHLTYITILTRKDKVVHLGKFENRRQVEDSYFALQMDQRIGAISGAFARFSTENISLATLILTLNKT